VNWDFEKRKLVGPDLSDSRLILENLLYNIPSIIKLRAIGVFLKTNGRAIDTPFGAVLSSLIRKQDIAKPGATSCQDW
jgi:hypothetical protein